MQSQPKRYTYTRTTPNAATRAILTSPMIWSRLQHGKQNRKGMTMERTSAIAARTIGAAKIGMKLCSGVRQAEGKGKSNISVSGSE